MAPRSTRRTAALAAAAAELSGSPKAAENYNRQYNHGHMSKVRDWIG